MRKTQSSYRYRPGLASAKGRWWPSKPPPSGGHGTWQPREAEVKWLATGKGLRKKSTKTHTLCAGGPLHGIKVKRVVKITTGRKAVPFVAMPDLFAVPPYRGHYAYDKSLDRYEWRS